MGAAEGEGFPAWCPGAEGATERCDHSAHLWVGEPGVVWGGSCPRMEVGPPTRGGSDCPPLLPSPAPARRPSPVLPPTAGSHISRGSQAPLERQARERGRNVDSKLSWALSLRGSHLGWIDAPPAKGQGCQTEWAQHTLQLEALSLSFPV